jgi:DNA mismatch repair protein MutS
MEKMKRAVLTQRLKQYQAVKQKYPDAILFFRAGDRYEMFFEDAERATPILRIALTSVSMHQGQDIPMCSVPFPAVNAYALCLTAFGFRVAVCDPVKDPATAKGLAAQEMTRAVTPNLILLPKAQNPSPAPNRADVVRLGEKTDNLVAAPWMRLPWTLAALPGQGDGRPEPVK